MLSRLVGRTAKRAFSSAASKQTVERKQLSYFSGTATLPLLYKTISQQLRDTAAVHGNSFAVYSEHENIRLTYSELLDKTERMAAGLLALGLSKQARVGVFTPTVIDYYIVQLACSMADLVLVNINPGYKQNELEFALNKVGCEAIMIVSKLRTTDYDDMIRKLAPDIGQNGKTSITSKLVPSLKYAIKLDSVSSPGFLQSKDLYKLGSTEENLKKMREVEDLVQAEDMTNIQFTSGTTGSPKATCLSHFNIINNGNLLAEHIKYTEHDKILCSVPLYHCFGMVMCNLAGLCRGAEILYPHAAFEATTSLKVASEKGATALYGVPTMFIELCNQVENNPGKYNLSKVRGGVIAGSICPRPLMEKARDVLNCKELIIGYGMTETSPLSFLTSKRDSIDKQVSTVGRVMPHTEAKLVDLDGRVTPIGQRGEICTRGYGIMKEYWKDPTATNDSIDNDGWMHTGDVGTFDSDGYLSVVGRIKDMINRGGEKIFPKEVEEFLLRHPKVFNVQVFAFPDERFGEEVFCWIKCKSGHELTNQEVLEYCKESIAHFKIPRYLKFVDDFPITVTGKPQKFKMTESMVVEIGSDKTQLQKYRLR